MLPIIIFILILIVVFLACLKTNAGRQQSMQVFRDVYIAHRGLFDNNEEYPENSKKAFERSVECGYGIELDVQLTKDKQLVVFHDDNLKRMCGADIKLSDATYEELKSYNLMNSEQKIPAFQEVLDIIDGKVPLIVEIKTSEKYLELCESVAEVLGDYKGTYCIESFHPMVVAWYKKNFPEVVRGQLSTNYRKDNSGRNIAESFVLTNLLLNFYTKPDFIAYNHIYKNQISYRLCKKLYKPVNVAWTIKSMEELREAKKDFDIIIFDSFIPEKI